MSIGESVLVGEIPHVLSSRHSQRVFFIVKCIQALHTAASKEGHPEAEQIRPESCLHPPNAPAAATRINVEQGPEHHDPELSTREQSAGVLLHVPCVRQSRIATRAGKDQFLAVLKGNNVRCNFHCMFVSACCVQRYVSWSCAKYRACTWREYPVHSKELP